MESPAFVPPPEPVVTAVLDGLAEGELELPALPAGTIEVLAELDSRDANLHRATRLIARDPGLAAAVLRLANSAVWAPAAPIHGLNEAAARLGLRHLREVVTARAVRETVFHEEGLDADLVQRLWRHGARAGVLARELARLAHADVESALLVGLLHDVGRPVVLRLVAVHERRVGARLTPVDRRAVADVLHAPVGAMLALEWRLPHHVAVAAEHHHDPDGAGEHLEAALLAQLADELETRGRMGDHAAETALDEDLVRFGVDPDDARALAGSDALDELARAA